MRLILIFGIYCMLNFPLVYSQSNEGTDFWMTFLEHFDEGGADKVLMITSRVNTSGVVEMPLANWKQDFRVEANEVSFIFMPPFSETLGSETINQAGVHITSEKAVSVYAHQFATFRSEAAVVLPSKSLGNEYYVMTYRGYDQDITPFPSEFVIVPIEDNTRITFTPKDQLISGNPAGISQTIVLNAGESYQVQALEGNNGDLTGSRISGDKPFAVFSGNKWTQIPNGCNARDNLFEQMWPVATWGKEFISIPNTGTNFDIFRIVASENNTTVNVDGGTPLNFTLNAGGFQEYQWQGPGLITADKPIMIGQFNVGRDCNGLEDIGDPSMVLLNSIDQTRDTITLFSSPFQGITENYVNLVVRTDDIASVTMDGKKLLNSGIVFIPFPSRPELSFTTVSVKDGSHTFISDGCGLIATAYGYGPAESYAYAGGASFRNINANPLPEGACLNEAVTFDSGVEGDEFSFFWDFGDGSTSTLAKPTHAYRSLGRFPIRLEITNTCSNTSNEFQQDFWVNQEANVVAPTDTVICEGEAISLFASDIALGEYYWTGPNEFESTEQSPIIFNSTTSMSGTYGVQAIVQGCSSRVAQTIVDINPTPRPFLGRDTTLCEGESILLDPGVFASYRWQNDTTSRFFEVITPGTYTVEVSDNAACIGRDEVLILEKCPDALFAPNAFSPNGDGVNDEFGLINLALTTVEYKIFDRWGSMIFAAENEKILWNGYLSNGKPAPQGVYSWVASVEGLTKQGKPYFQQFYGTVTLIR